MQTMSCTFRTLGILILALKIVPSISAQQIPSENSTADVGKGYDSFRGAAMKGCVEYSGAQTDLTQQTGDPQAGHLNLTHSTSSEEFASSLAINAAASFAFGVYSGDLSVSYSHSEKLNRYSEYLLVSTHVENERRILKKPVLSALGRRAASKGPTTFFLTCGDQFIEGYVNGGEFTAIVNASSSSKEEQTDASLTLHAAASGSGSLDLSVKQKITNLQNEGRLSVDVTRKGPAENFPKLTVLELIEYARTYPSKVSSSSKNAWTISYLTSDYTGLVEFPKYNPVQRRVMNRLAQQVRQLYYRRASLLYIKANPAQFLPFEETHLDSELKQLTQSIDDVTGAAEDCGQDAKNCKPPQEINVPSAPDRMGTSTIVDPSLEGWKFVGSSIGADTKVVVVTGSWVNHCENGQPKGRTILPGESDQIKMVSRKTGVETFASASKPGLVPANSDVYYRVGDVPGQYFDNCPHDGIKVYLASPLYPDDYKPLVLTSQ